MQKLKKLINDLDKKTVGKLALAAWLVTMTWATVQVGDMAATHAECQRSLADAKEALLWEEVLEKRKAAEAVPQKATEKPAAVVTEEAAPRLEDFLRQQRNERLELVSVWSHGIALHSTSALVESVDDVLTHIAERPKLLTVGLLRADPGVSDEEVDEIARRIRSTMVNVVRL